MKRIASSLAIIPLLVACSGGAPTSVASSPSVPPATATAVRSATPTPIKTAPYFNTAELALLQAAGWSATESGAEEFIESAHQLCDTFDKTTDEDAFEALRGSTPDKKRTAGQILMLLCSDSERYMQIVVAVEIPEARASGTYYVGDGDDDIKPGDYRTIGGVRNCYWVRKDKKGEIIDNDLVSNAPGGVQMTVKASDYEVTMERCGLWIPNK